MLNKLYAAVYEEPNLKGAYRVLTEDECDFEVNLAFARATSSIIVFAGRGYRAGDVIRFYENPNFQGTYIDLHPGSYKNLGACPFNFSDKISSAKFCPDLAKEVQQNLLEVSMRVRIWQKGDFQGQYRDIVSSTPDLSAIGFNETTSSVQIIGAPYYREGDCCNFFSDAEYQGDKLQPGDFTPNTPDTELRALYTDKGFNNKITSINIHRVPV